VLDAGGVTFAVSIVMYRPPHRRDPREADPAAVDRAVRRDGRARSTDTRASDNYRNLFEGPVLFYVAALAAFALKVVTPAILVLAWLYVACRRAHSLVHCTTNRVQAPLLRVRREPRGAVRAVGRARGVDRHLDALTCSRRS
jgi:hypothetical protein